MVEAALAVAIAAIAITLFGVILQWLAYRATIEQAQRAAQSAADMRAEIHDLVGELRGITERMVEAQERQFNRMLDAFVTRPRTVAEVADSATRSAVTVEELRAMLDDLRAQMEKAATGEAVLDRLGVLEDRLDEVRDATAGAARLAERASARRADWAVLEPSVRHTRVAGPPRPALVRLRVSAREIRPGGSVMLEPLGWLPAGDMEYLLCVVRAPSGATAAVAVRQDLKWGTRLRVLYPDEFLNSSTEEEGEYVVTLRSHQGGMRSPPGAVVAQASFVVAPEGRRP